MRMKLPPWIGMDSSVDDDITVSGGDLRDLQDIRDLVTGAVEDEGIPPFRVFLGHVDQVFETGGLDDFHRRAGLPAQGSNRRCPPVGTAYVVPTNFSKKIPHRRRYLWGEVRRLCVKKCCS